MAFLFLGNAALEIALIAIFATAVSFIIKKKFINNKEFLEKQDLLKKKSERLKELLKKENPTKKEINERESLQKEINEMSMEILPNLTKAMFLNMIFVLGVFFYVTLAYKDIVIELPIALPWIDGKLYKETSPIIWYIIVVFFVSVSLSIILKIKEKVFKT